MRSIRYILFILLIVAFQATTAQRQRDLDRASAYRQIGEYENAARFYRYALRKHNADSVLPKLIYCYEKRCRFSSVAKLYPRIKKPTPAEEALYMRSLAGLGRYKELEKQVKKHKYLKTSRWKTLLDSLPAWKQKTRVQITNLKELNSPYSEFGAVPYPGGIVFCSNKEEIVIRKKSGDEEQPYFNIYLAKTDSQQRNIFKFLFKNPSRTLSEIRQTDGDFRPAIPSKNISPFSEKLNSGHHETSPHFTRDYKMLYFNLTKQAGHQAENDTLSRVKLYGSLFKNGNWGDLQRFIMNDSLCSYLHPCISPDETMFFFASDRKGGYGGTDLYVCLNFGKGWSEPRNLGPQVNTSGNELYPFIHENGTLYFCSDTHPGLGGYDIFRASETKGEWGKVANMRIPINSAYDDLSPYILPGEQSGFFSSNRPGGMGREDIYFFQVIFRTRSR